MKVLHPIKALTFALAATSALAENEKKCDLKALDNYGQIVLKRQATARTAITDYFETGRNQRKALQASEYVQPAIDSFQSEKKVCDESSPYHQYRAEVITQNVKDKQAAADSKAKIFQKSPADKKLIQAREQSFQNALRRRAVSKRPKVQMPWKKQKTGKAKITQTFIHREL